MGCSILILSISLGKSIRIQRVNVGNQSAQPDEMPQHAAPHLDQQYSKLLVKSEYQKIIFLFLNQSICCGYSKELSQ